MGGGRRGATLLFVTALALTLIAAFPVVQHPTERIYGAEIVGRHHDPFTVMRQFDGQAIPAPYLQPATDWLGRGVARAIGPIAAYNVVILWTFPLAALFAYLLAFDITGSRLAAGFAGLAFAFSPFHVAQAAYHPHVAQVQWVGLYFLALWRVTHAATLARLALFAVATTLVCLSNFYGGLIAMSLTPIAAMAFWRSPGADGRRGSIRDLTRAAAAWTAMGVAGVAAIVVLAPGVLSGSAPRVPAIGELASYSARAISYVLPPVDHPMLGATATRYWELEGNRIGVLEQQVTAGYGVLILAAIALWQAWRSRAPMTARTAVALTLVGVAAFVCSLAPEGRIGILTWPRPSAWLYAIAPMFRSYARFAVVVQLMAVVLAGAGAAALWNRGGWVRRMLVVLACGVTAWVYAPIAARSRDVMPTAAHRWLAGGEPVTRVLECRPAGLSDLNTAWLLHRPVDFLSGEEDCAASDIAMRMRGQQVSHLLVRRNRREYAWLQAHPRADLRLRASLDDGAIWDVPPSAAFDPYVMTLQGPFPREYDADKAWRWMGESAAWTIVNPRKDDVVAVFEVELTAFASSRSFGIAVNGAPLGAVRVDVVKGVVALPPLALRAGKNLMTWTSIEPPSRPDAISDSGDPRALSVSIGEWRFVGVR